MDERTEKLFPIMASQIHRDELRDLRAAGITTLVIEVPWSLIEPHEAQARSNHGGQSLRRLADRGGLGACEAVAVLEDRRWERMREVEAQRALALLLEVYRARRPAT